MATLRENFATNLKRLLQEREMTQRSLAEALGMTEAMVSKWTTKNGFPEERQIERVAKVLKVPYEELFKDPADTSDQVVRLLRDLAKARGYDLVKKP